MFKKKRELPEEYYELRKIYTMQKTDKARLRVLEEMLKTIPPKRSEFNKVRSHTTKLMRKMRERIRKAEHREATLKHSSKFFKTDFFSIALFGDANSGKTHLLNSLCKTNHPSTPKPFETKKPIIGVFKHLGAIIRVVEVPSAIKNKQQKILRESDLIILMPGDKKRYLEFINDYEIETPVKILDKHPNNNWGFLGLIVVELKGKLRVLFKGSTINDVGLTEAMINGELKDGVYTLKDGDIIKES